MKIVVCIKQVPSSNKVRMDPETNTIIRDGRQSVINPFDAYAVEQAVQIKEALGGEVYTLSMGIPETEKLLRDTLARGADGAMLLSDRKFAGADTLATAYTLSLGISRMDKVDLVLCGKMAVDGDTAQIGPELAEHLGIPHVTDVQKIIEINEEYIICKRAVDGGYERIQVQLPALLTVVKDINMPRLPAIQGIRESYRKTLEVLDAEQINADTARTGIDGSPTQVVKTFIPKRSKQVQFIEGDKTAQTDGILTILEGVL
ncbi:electron transfer flavoprotein subunit beta/FixA family protein [Clostridia bacterium OttesenSCG-928-F22]|nr:electron transfer flavoprotein subunit beta/FixA family protein [Clostridia bacterium OttesenSCG-928-F22]